MYENGRGVMQNEVKAIEYYKLAQEKGCQTAKCILEDRMPLIEKNSAKLAEAEAAGQLSSALNDEKIMVEKKAFR